MPLFFTHHQQAGRMQRRQGLTLIELLTVIAVLAILLSVAIPVIRPALKDRKLRESSRLLSAYCAGVQARAAALGRPVGIVLVRSNNSVAGIPNSRDLYQCTEVLTAEIPQPYSGDVIDAKATVSHDPDAGGANGWTVNFAGNAFFDTIILPGEHFLLRLDYKNPLFQCQRTGNQTARIIPNASLNLAGPPWQHINSNHGPKRPVPFQIYRSPTRSAASPLQLPRGMGIDLSVSGIGFKGNQFNPDSQLGPGNITIMFSPNGSVDSIYVGNQVLPQTTKVYLLIGRVNQINPVNPFQTDIGGNQQANLRDPSSIWFSISPKTGQIRNSLNRTDLIGNPADTGTGIQQARKDAIEGIGVGGR